MDKKIIELEIKLNEYEKELKILENNKNQDIEEINLTKCLISMIKDDIEELKNPKEKKHFNKYDYFKPEYREDGYFQSKDFEEKCEMFDKFVKENDMEIPKEYYGEALQIFLKENFNIDWEWDDNKRLLDEYKDEIIIVH